MLLSMQATIDEVSQLTGVSTHTLRYYEKRFAELRRAGDSSMSDRCKLLEAHRLKVVEEISALTQHLQVIDRKIQHYKENKSCEPKN